jgi:hypothetical protein
MTTFAEHIYRNLMAERDDARLNATYWRNKYEAAQQALANESLAHHHTQERYMHLVKNMADIMAQDVRPRMMIVREGEVDRKALEEIMARGAQ